MSDPLATTPLSAIRVFDAAARHLSFTRAADELGMTQAAVSWQVKALERRLDRPLFRRLPREVALTPAGERLARAAAEAMRLLRSAIADLAADVAGVLSISATQTFATQWLAPRLGVFQLAQPSIAVRLEAESRLVDFSREEVDVAVRTGAGVWPGLDATRLFPTLVTALCTPEMAASLGDGATPSALIAAPRIGRQWEWALWFEAAQAPLPAAGPAETARFIADAQLMEVAAALGGQGAVLASPILFSAEIAAGRLVQPWPVTFDAGGGVWLVHAAERRDARKIRLFKTWLLEAVAADPAIARFTAQASPVGR